MGSEELLSEGTIFFLAKVSWRESFENSSAAHVLPSLSLLATPRDIPTGPWNGMRAPDESQLRSCSLGWGLCSTATKTSAQKKKEIREGGAGPRTKF